LEESKRHPFFKSIDFSKLMQKSIPPPVILKMEEEDEESEELAYLK
jgi:hypothetical protein